MFGLCAYKFQISIAIHTDTHGEKFNFRLILIKNSAFNLISF